MKKLKQLLSVFVGMTNFALALGPTSFNIQFVHSPTPPFAFLESYHLIHGLAGGAYPIESNNISFNIGSGSDVLNISTDNYSDPSAVPYLMLAYDSLSYANGPLGALSPNNQNNLLYYAIYGDLQFIYNNESGSCPVGFATMPTTWWSWPSPVNLAFGSTGYIIDSSYNSSLYGGIELNCEYNNESNIKFILYAEASHATGFYFALTLNN
jgi:hypothetical protein